MRSHPSCSREYVLQFRNIVTNVQTEALPNRQRLGIRGAFAIVSAPKEPEMKKTFLLTAILIALACTSLFAQGKATPIPSVTGPVPVSAESYPWNSASKVQTPVDVTSKGYVEEEYFITGK